MEIILWEAPEVGGISVDYHHIKLKLCQLADNMTLILGSTHAVIVSVHMFEECYHYTGLKVKEK